MTRAAAAWAALLSLLCAEANAGSLDVTVVTTAGQAVEDAAVVAEPVAGVAPRHRATATIEQRDREFVPYLTIVQAGTAVEFPNRDPVKHHVYSFSPAKVFEIKLYAGKPVQPVIFDKVGDIALGCNIHDWMEAYVLVTNSPYFAKTAASGVAHVANVPSGRYRLHVWHPRQKSEAPLREIDLDAAPLRLEVVLDVAPRVTKPKAPADADHY